MKDTKFKIGDNVFYVPVSHNKIYEIQIKDIYFDVDKMEYRYNGFSDDVLFNTFDEANKSISKRIEDKKLEDKDKIGIRNKQKKYLAKILEVWAFVFSAVMVYSITKGHYSEWSGFDFILIPLVASSYIMTPVVGYYIYKYIKSSD